MPDFVLTERPLERVAHVILNRPERRNALIGPLADQLAETIEELNTDASLNVIVIRGAGNAFCSGLDLKEFAADPRPDWVPDFGRKWRRVHAAIFDSPHIVVGALERAAVNGGAALALACDFLVAGDNAFLQVGEIQQGMAAPMNMSWLRLRFAENVAARLALLGDRIQGQELVRLGVRPERDIRLEGAILRDALHRRDRATPEDEHPQVIAALLLMLEPEPAAEVLSELSQELQSAVVTRVAKMCP